MENIWVLHPDMLTDAPLDPKANQDDMEKIGIMCPIMLPDAPLDPSATQDVMEKIWKLPRSCSPTPR